MDDYTGCVNLETIDDVIIEVHLRLNGDTQLYDENFAQNLNSYLTRNTNTIEYDIPLKYLIPVFVRPTHNYDGDANELRKTILELGVKYNAQSIMFDNTKSNYQSEYLSRFMIFDCDDLELGFEFREKILSIL